MRRRLDFPGEPGFATSSLATTDDEIIERLAASLGLRAASTQELRRDVTDWLRFSQALLIVDNCEHVAARIADRARSRTRRMRFNESDLHQPARVEHRMASTSCASILSGDRWISLAAVDSRIPGSPFLSSEPGRQGLPWTPVIRHLIEIVDRVDGLPLAIELAARRLTAMTPPELLARLNRSFDLLDAADGTPHHRQALRATLDWSFGLLAPISRRMLAALSVCEGGFGLELAEALGRAIGLSDSEVARAVADLWDQSLISTEGSFPGRARYRMLALIQGVFVNAAGLDGNRPRWL